MKNNIVKAVGLVTIVTVIGKLLGFGRESVIAAFTEPLHNQMFISLPLLFLLFYSWRLVWLLQLD